MTIEYDPQQITDWLTPLEKVYARQSRQLDTYHQQLRQRDAQQEAADTQISIPDVATKLANLSITIKKISDTKTEKSHEKTKKEFEALPISDQKIIDEQVKDESVLSKNSTDLVKYFRDKGLDEKGLTFIEQYSGGRNIKLKRLAGWNIVRNGISIIDADIENDKTGKLQLEYDEAVRANRVDTFYRGQIRQKLAPLKLSERFISAHFEPAIQRFSNTKKLKEKLDYKTVKFQQQNEEHVASFSNLKLNPKLNPLSASTELNNLVTQFRSLDPIKGKNNAVNFLYRLNKAGKIDGTVIDAMKKGELMKFPGGKEGDKIFSADDWRFIEQGEQEYLTQVKANHDAEYALRGARMEAAIIKEETTQEQVDSFLLDAKINGQEHTDWYKKLSNYNSNAYNKDRAAQINKDFQKLWDNSSLTLQDIKNEKNIILENKWTPLVEGKIKWDKDNKWTEQEGVIEGEVSNYTRKRSFDVGESKTTDEQNAITLIQQKANELKADKLLVALQNNLPTNNIKFEVQEEVEAWKLRNGWGEENGPGIFSYVTKNGNRTLPNLSRNLKRLNTAGYHYNLKNNNISQAISKRQNDYPDRAIRHKTPDGIISKNLLLGYRQNGYFNEEWKEISAEEGLLPGQAYELAIKALENGDDNDKEFVKRYNFKPGDTEPKPDVQMSNLLTKRLTRLSELPEAKLVANEESVIQSIQHIMRWYGPDYLNLHQRQLIYTILQTVSPVTEGVTDPIKRKVQEMKAAGTSQEGIQEFLQGVYTRKLREDMGIIEVQKGDLTSKVT